TWVETGFALAIAAAIVASLNVVGATLIAATIAIPPTTARLMTDSFGRMIVLSTIIGALCGFCGMFISYWYDIASGASIVLLSAAVFAAVLAVTSLRNTLRSRRAPASVSAIPAPLAAAGD
ncbi:MAG: metal ABC transporter permease, partial [Thermomicrobiales bacterium]